MVDHIYYELLKYEVENYCKDPKLKRQKEFTASLNHGTSLGEVWGWVKELRDNQQKRPVESIGLMSGRETEDVLDEMLERLATVG